MLHKSGLFTIRIIAIFHIKKLFFSIMVKQLFDFEVFVLFDVLNSTSKIALQNRTLLWEYVVFNCTFSSLVLFRYLIFTMLHRRYCKSN